MHLRLLMTAGWSGRVPGPAVLRAARRPGVSIRRPGAPGGIFTGRSYRPAAQWPTCARHRPRGYTRSVGRKVHGHYLQGYTRPRGISMHASAKDTFGPGGRRLLTAPGIHTLGLRDTLGHYFTTLTQHFTQSWIARIVTFPSVVPPAPTCPMNTLSPGERQLVSPGNSLNLGETEATCLSRPLAYTGPQPAMHWPPNMGI
jgi:hypothetical protein